MFIFDSLFGNRKKFAQKSDLRAYIQYIILWYQILELNL